MTTTTKPTLPTLPALPALPAPFQMAVDIEDYKRRCLRYGASPRLTKDGVPNAYCTHAFEMAQREQADARNEHASIRRSR